MDAVKPKKNRSIQFSLHYYLHHGLNFVHFLPPSGNHVLLIYLKIIIYISLRNYHKSFQFKQISFMTSLPRTNTGTLYRTFQNGSLVPYNQLITTYEAKLEK